MKIKQTAGRTQLGIISEEFAKVNDDILFGEVWSKDDAISIRDRILLTISVLTTKGIFDSSFEYHVFNAKQNGITIEEISDAITHIAFYAGWPNGWAGFNVVKKVYGIQ